MRVVLYYPRALVGNGGMTRAVSKLALGLTELGADVVVACDGGVSQTRGGVAWAAVPHIGGSVLRMPLGIGTVLRGADLLVLHSAWALHNARAAAVARAMGVRYILAPRGAYDPAVVRRKRWRKLGWWALLEQDLVRNASGMHIFFDSERPHIEALGYRGAVLVAPNGVDVPPGVRWDGGSGRYVLWLGRFDPEHKGLDLLLKAVAVLPRDRRPLLRLHGPDKGGGKVAIRRLAKALRLEDVVTIGEPVYGDNKWRLLSSAAAFAYPSRWEAFGNSTAEAVLAGVPTLVTRYPLGEYLAGRGGAVVAESTPEALAEGLEHVLSPRGAEIAGKGARIMRAEFGWEDVSRSWLRQMAAIR